MLQTANTYLFDPLVPKAHNSVSKYAISFTNLANKSLLKLVRGFYLLLLSVHSALMG